MDQYLFPLKKSIDKKHRIAEAIQNIKDSLLKRKFNQAWDYAAKYYEQNKSALRNDQIYQLCWLSCQSISKKIHARLISSPKSYLPILTQSHMQDLFSLYLSLHLQLFPQARNLNSKYFSMLSVTQTVINPKSVSPHGLVFQRKEGQFFMQEQQSHKQLKKLVKLHLRITNNALMFKIKIRKKVEDVIEAISSVQGIFDSFGQYEFPVESINFELVKLSVMQDLKIKQGIQCVYRLPIGLMNKIYLHLKGNKDDAVNHYVKKLTSYMVLSFRNLTLSIQDMYIICHEMIYLAKAIQEKATPLHKTGLKARFNKLKINRQITIQDPVDQANAMNRSIKSNFSNSFSTSTKISDKKLESKTKLGKTEGSLKSVAMLALQKINKYLEGRKQINHIILAYFNKSFLNNIKNDPQDQIIESQVLLLRNSKNKDKDKKTQYNGRKSNAQNRNSLSQLLKQKGVHKKAEAFDTTQENEGLPQNIEKAEQKFIIRNIQNLSKSVKAHQQTHPKLLNLIETTQTKMDRIEIIDESSSDEQLNLQHCFERQRRQHIMNTNKKYSFNPNKSSNNLPKLNEQSDQNFLSCKEEERARQISLLDDVVSNQIKHILQFPEKENNDPGESGISMSKLASLRMEAENLNIERALLVQRLTSRSNRVNLDDSFSLNTKPIQRDQYKDIPSNFNSKLGQYKAVNKQKLKKEGNFQTNQPKIKLKLDKQGRKLPELTFANLQDQYNKILGLSNDKRVDEEMFLSCNYDKLRRDVSKNQFASQNEVKNNSRKAKCRTILEKSNQDEINNEQAK